MRFATSLIRTTFTVALGFAALGCGSKDAAPPAQPLTPCPTNYKAVTDQSKPFACSCDGKTTTGSVWGDGIYTADSVICRAAVHAGAITAGQPGDVTILKAAGCAGYRGSDKNGVRTSRWGSYETSYYFEGHGDGTCKLPEEGVAATLGDLKAAAKDLKTQAAAGIMAVGGDPTAFNKATDDAAKGLVKAGKALEADVKAKLGGVTGHAKPLVSDGDCPRNFAAAGKAEVTCTCGKAEGPNGTVYGAHPFTADSSICASARVLGLIAAAGGPVTATAAPGCSMYKSIEANGVHTNAWGSYSKSFVFPAKGAVQCPTLGATDACPTSFAAAGKDSVTCTCSPTGARGPVYGSNPYTADSSICVAAKHAGLLKDSPVQVTATQAAGCARYLGTEANGVTTTAWGSYPTSFVFAGKPGACPAK